MALTLPWSETHKFFIKCNVYLFKSYNFLSLFCHLHCHVGYHIGWNLFHHQIRGPRSVHHISTIFEFQVNNFNLQFTIFYFTRFKLWGASNLFGNNSELKGVLYLIYFVYFLGILFLVGLQKSTQKCDELNLSTLPFFSLVVKMQPLFQWH